MARKPKTLQSFNPGFSRLVAECAAKPSDQIPPFCFHPGGRAKPYSVAIDFRRSLHEFLKLLRETPDHPLHENAVLWTKTKTISAPEESTDSPGTYVVRIKEARFLNPEDPITKALHNAGFSPFQALSTESAKARTAKARVSTYLTEEESE